MPIQPSWIHRVPQILEELERDSSLPFLDRDAVERLFGLSTRQANRLIRSCQDAFLVGRSIVVLRSSLVQAVRQWKDSGAVEWEHRRRQRVGETLADARQEAGRLKIRFPVQPDVFTRSFADLPSGIAFEPGLLKISFTNPVELLQKLFELAQAISQDYEVFNKVASK